MTACEGMLAWYEGRFEREYRDACVEYDRLQELFRDVCWYNFETTCRAWAPPWRESRQDSEVQLLGMSFRRKWSRGRLIEHGHFPSYYTGVIRDAPVLPPQVVLSELRAAEEYMGACKTQMSAPRDWAPGGRLYENLARRTLVGRSHCVYDPKKS